MCGDVGRSGCCEVKWGGSDGVLCCDPSHRLSLPLVWSVVHIRCLSG